MRAACPNAGDSPNARTKTVGGLAIFRGNIRAFYGAKEQVILNVQETDMIVVNVDLLFIPDDAFHFF